MSYLIWLKRIFASYSLGAQWFSTNASPDFFLLVDLGEYCIIKINENYSDWPAEIWMKFIRYENLVVLEQHFRCNHCFVFDSPCILGIWQYWRLWKTNVNKAYPLSVIKYECQLFTNHALVSLEGKLSRHPMHIEFSNKIWKCR